MRVREAQAHDIQQICKIAIETFSLACPPDTPASELKNYIDANFTASSFERILADERYLAKVIEKDEEVIGFSLLDFSAEAVNVPDADGIPELTRCYVSQLYHGSGAAQVLLSETLADIDSPVRLMVNDQNSRAIRFYERYGFKQKGETSFECGNDIHRDLVMVRATSS